MSFHKQWFLSIWGSESAGFKMSDLENETNIAVTPPKVLSEAAKRALKEAEDRRAKAEAEEKKALELGGPKGLEPTRFGDWERKGIAYDF